MLVIALLASTLRCVDGQRIRGHNGRESLHKQATYPHHNPLTLLLAIYHLHHDELHISGAMRDRKIIQFGAINGDYKMIIDASTILSNSTIIVLEKNETARRRALQDAALHPRDKHHDETEGPTNVTFQQTFHKSIFNGADMVVLLDKRYNATKLAAKVDKSSPQLIVALQRLPGFDTYAILSTNITGQPLWYVHNVERAIWPGHEPSPDMLDHTPIEGKPYRPPTRPKHDEAHAVAELRLPFFQVHATFRWTIEFHRRFCIGSSRVEGCCGAFVLPFVEGSEANVSAILLDDFCALHGAHFSVITHTNIFLDYAIRDHAQATLDDPPAFIESEETFIYKVPLTLGGISTLDDHNEHIDYRPIYFVLHVIHDIAHHHRFTYELPDAAPTALAEAARALGTYDLFPSPTLMGVYFQFAAFSRSNCSVTVQRDGIIPPHHVLVDVGDHPVLNVVVEDETPFADPIFLRPQHCRAIADENASFYMHVTFVEDVPCFTYFASLSEEMWSAVRMHAVGHRVSTGGGFMVPFERSWKSRPDINFGENPPKRSISACGRDDVPAVEAQLIWHEHLHHFGLRVFAKDHSIHVRRFELTGVAQFTNGSQQLMFHHHCYSGHPDVENLTPVVAREILNLRYAPQQWFVMCDLSSIAELGIYLPDGIERVNITLGFNTTVDDDEMMDPHELWLVDNGGYRHPALQRNITELRMSLHPSIAPVAPGDVLLAVPTKIIPDVDRMLQFEPWLREVVKNMTRFHGDDDQLVDIMEEFAALSILAMEPMENPFFGDNYVIPMLEIEEIWNRTDRLHLVRGLPVKNFHSADNHQHRTEYVEHHGDNVAAVQELEAIFDVADQQYIMLRHFHRELVGHFHVHQWIGDDIPDTSHFVDWVSELATLLMPTQILFPDFLLLQLSMEPNVRIAENATHVSIVLDRPVKHDGTPLRIGCRVPYHFMYFFKGEKNIPDEMDPESYPEGYDFSSDPAVCLPSFIWRRKIVLAATPDSAKVVVKHCNNSRALAKEEMEKILQEDTHSHRKHRHRDRKSVV